MRWLCEGIRPEIRQYLIESDADAFPFSREQRSLVYQRAKQEVETVPFGTQQEVYKPEYVYFTHSLAPRHLGNFDFRVPVGGTACRRGYAMSLLTVSAVSCGSHSCTRSETRSAGQGCGSTCN